MRNYILMLLLASLLVLPLSTIYARAYCQPNKAYMVGVRDGKNNWRYQKRYGLRRCGKNKKDVNQSYIQGYKAGKAGKTLAQEQCLKKDFGEVCGYDCKRNKANQIKCARYPTQKCLIDDNDNIHCGYHCVSASGNVKCGTSFLDKCVTDGKNIRCGRNCHKTQKGIQCGTEA